MKIGVMTFWWDDENYGQTLQCYALQEWLKREGHEPFLIKYRPIGRKYNYWRVFNPVFMIKYLLLRKRFNQYGEFNAKRPRGIQQFLEANVSCSRIFNGFASLKSNPPDADVYCVGSDQVWNCHRYDRDLAPWFLDFGSPSTKRMAYAASFGVESLSEAALKSIAPMLQKFDSIGVREDSGIDLCAQAGRMDAVHVADPTFLLNISHYENLIDKPNYWGRYIFCYLITDQPMPWAEIKSFAKNEDAVLKVVPSVGLFSDKVFDEFVTPTLPEWLDGIRRSRFCFVSSFHGAVFCIIFQRPFLVFLPDKSSGNVRVLSLLKRLGLSARIYKSGDDISSLMMMEINWSHVAEEVCRMKDVSCCFIEKSLAKE